MLAAIQQPHQPSTQSSPAKMHSTTLALLFAATATVLAAPISNVKPIWSPASMELSPVIRELSARDASIQEVSKDWEQSQLQ